MCECARAHVCLAGGGASPGALPAPLTSQLARVFTPVLAALFCVQNLFLSLFLPDALSFSRRFQSESVY